MVAVVAVVLSSFWYWASNTAISIPYCRGKPSNIANDRNI